MRKIIDYLNKNVNKDINESLIKFVEDRKGHDRRYAIDATNIKDELGWAPGVEFEEGIVKTIKWYLYNQEWIYSIENRDI